MEKNRFRIGDALLGALVGASATLLAPIVPRLIFPAVPDVHVVSALADSPGQLELVLKNDGRGSGVVSAMRLHVDRLRFEPVIASGGYLPLIVSYLAPPDTVDIQRLTPYVVDVPAGSINLSGGEAARIGVQVPANTARKGVVEGRVGALVDGKESDPVAIELPLATVLSTPQMPSETEVVEFLGKFDAHFDPLKPATTFFRLETQRDPITDKEVLVAVLQYPDARDSVRVAHVLWTDDVATQRPLAEQSLRSSTAREFRTEQKMDSTEAAWFRQALETTDLEWGTRLVALAATVLPRADHWLKDDEMRVEAAENLLARQQQGEDVTVASLALAAKQLASPGSIERRTLVHRIAAAVASGLARKVIAVETIGPDLGQRVLELERASKDLTDRAGAVLRAVLERLPADKRSQGE